MYDYLHKEAKRIVNRCGTRDPLKIASDLGIHVIFDNDFATLKGMYVIIKRSRFIIINGNLNERDINTVCAHEIGHDRFHRALAKSGALQELMLYDMKRRPEYEANIFASDILIDDFEILELIEYDYDMVQIARELGVDLNLVLIKIDALQSQGYGFRVPYRPPADFLGRN